MKTALWVALGGAVGSVARYAVGLAAARWLPGRLPWGTLLVNVLGSCAIGFAMAFFGARGKLDSEVRLTLTVGILGGFTTYSAFAFEVVTLWSRREMTALSLYVGLLFAASLLGCALGIALGRSAA